MTTFTLYLEYVLLMAKRLYGYSFGRTTFGTDDGSLIVIFDESFIVRCMICHALLYRPNL